MRVRSPLEFPVARFLSVLLALACAAAHAAPPQDDASVPPTPGEPQVVTTIAPKLSEPKLEPLAQTMRVHMVRVRVFTEYELRRVDGVLIDRHRYDYGICGGVIVSDDPLVMVSDSALRRDIGGIDLPAKNELDPARRMFEIVLDDDTRLPAKIVRKDEGLNVLLLRPDDPSRWPAEKRAITELGPAPVASQHIGVVAFVNAEVSPQLRVFEEAITQKSAEYERPALVRLALGYLGFPVCDADLRMVGIVNLPPPSEPYPRASLNFPAVNPPPGRDPREWSLGTRKPLLIPAARLAPLFEELARQPRPVEFAPLGLTLADRDGGVLVLKVAADGAAARAGLASGDVLMKCGDSALAAVEGFSAALETALNADAQSLELATRRGDAARIVTMALP